MYNRPKRSLFKRDMGILGACSLLPPLSAMEEERERERERERKGRKNGGNQRSARGMYTLLYSKQNYYNISF